MPFAEIKLWKPGKNAIVATTTMNARTNVVIPELSALKIDKEISMPLVVGALEEPNAGEYQYHKKIWTQ